MRSFLYNKKRYHCPAGLSECTASQVGLVMVYQLSLELYASPKERTLSKVALLCQLSGLTEKQAKKLTATQMQSLIVLIAWAKNAQITGQPFESFEHEGITYYLPKEGFGNTSAIEVAMCCIYQSLLSKGKADILFSLIATLCRPQRPDLATQKLDADWDGDIREPYNSNTAEVRAKTFKTIKTGIARAIYLYYSAIAKAFFESYNTVLEPTDETPLYENGQGQVTLLMEIGEMKAFGDFEKVCRTNVHTIWMFIKDKKLKADRLADKHKNDE